MMANGYGLITFQSITRSKKIGTMTVMATEGFHVREGLALYRAWLLKGKMIPIAFYPLAVRMWGMGVDGY
jgi:hypothetical protein